MNRSAFPHRRAAHTLMELVVAMVCSVVLLAGLGSVMLIGRQIAFTPSAAVRRTQAATVVHQLADELRYATLILEQSPRAIEFLVTDRNADGAAEKIRYDWSGTLGDPLYKTLNGAAPAVVLDSVNAFDVAYLLQPKISAYTTTVDSAEAVRQSNTSVLGGTNRNINASSYSAQQINPAGFSAIPANATSWNLTRIDFYGRNSGPSNETLLVQLRRAGDPYDGPTNHVLGQVSVPESSLSSSLGWNSVTFSSPVRDLLLHRRYTFCLEGVGGGNAATLLSNDSATGGVLESDDSGASWQFINNRQIFYRIYGTYTTPGATYNVTRNYVSHVRIALRAGDKSHARIDASVPLVNLPELLSAYWRADFDANPTTTNLNGDAVADWAQPSGQFDAATLAGGIWTPAAALETRPPCDFNRVTTVDVRCRNTTVGGNGAVLRINADREGALYGPLLVYVQLQADGTQTLSLYAKSSDADITKLFSRSRLPSEFIRYQLTILPQNNVVNLQINGEDQGTFTYLTYTPSTSNDRFLTVYADTSQAEFDYVEVRVGTN